MQNACCVWNRNENFGFEMQDPQNRTRPCSKTLQCCKEHLQRLHKDSIRNKPLTSSAVTRHACLSEAYWTCSFLDLFAITLGNPLAPDRLFSDCFRIIK